MGVSKVTLNGITLMDVTDKTVDTDNLLAGNSALRNDGESITGAVVTASPSDASPAMDGTASAGVATTYSRGDHVHPSDTNKANINNPSFTGTPTAPTASKGTNTTQIATTAFVQSAIADINYPVTSVNSKTGTVVLTASDVNALPDDTEIPTKTSDLTNDSGYITNSDIPVTSVNTKTGDVVLTAADVNAQPQINISGILKGNGTGTITAATAGTDYQAPLPSQTGNTGKFLTTNGSALSWQTVDALPSQSGNTGKFLTTDGSSASWAEVDIPTKTSDLTNDSNFITAAGAPVQSVNSKTGAVTLTASDVGALPDSTDVTKWNGVTLNQGTSYKNNGDIYVPYLDSATGTVAYTGLATSTPTQGRIAKYDSNNYLHSTTPTASDNSNKVATTAYVDSAVGAITVPVTSVNSKTGAVVLTAADVGALPDTTIIPTATSDLTNDSGFITNSALSDYMQKGVDYVTAGKKSGTSLGTGATAEGLNATASGNYSHAEGVYTSATARASHAEGSTTTASNTYSHAEGDHTYATNQAAHAEGYSTTASGQYSHAEGYNTTASGNQSHTEGWGTTANHASQHAFGEYNILDTADTFAFERGDYVEIVGNGTADNARSNARTLDWSGNEVLAGKLTVGAGPTNNMDVATKTYVDTAIAGVESLPSQTSHNGEFLTTNGTVASWESLPEEVFVATYGTTTLAEILEAYNAGKFIYAVKSNNPGRLVPLEEYVSSIPQFYFSYITRGGTPQDWAVSNSGWTSTANTFGYVPTTRTINSKSLSNSITLTASDVGALPDSTTIPTATSDLTNDSGFITSSDIPVTSVNNKTGAVSLTASDVGALTNSYFGYLDSDNNIVYAPKNWNSSYLFPFIVRTISSTLRTGATVRAFDSSTNLWTISSVFYDGVAKTLPLSLSYGIYLMRYSDGTTDIYRIAKASDIPTLTSTPTANKGAQYDSSAYLNSTTPAANDNSTKVATTAYVDAAVAGAGSGAKGVTNPALTASEGIFTWSIAAADAFSSPNVIISVYDTATGAIVYPDIVVNQTTGAVTITIRDTTYAGSLAAGAYRVVMIG